jgi:hypothetical protein
MANTIRKQVEDEDPATVILELLDNSVYYCKQDDGSRVIPKKGLTTSTLKESCLYAQEMSRQSSSTC